jgi:hypothetical protein
MECWSTGVMGYSSSGLFSNAHTTHYGISLSVLFGLRHLVTLMTP